MLKNILEFNGVQILSKNEQKVINGGGPTECTTISITDDIYGPYNGGMYAAQTITYQCGDGPVQTGPYSGGPIE